MRDAHIYTLGLDPIYFELLEPARMSVDNNKSMMSIIIIVPTHSYYTILQENVVTQQVITPRHCIPCVCVRVARRY